MGEMDKDGRTFGEEVSNKFGELHKQQQLNVDTALQASLAHQIATSRP